MPDTRLEFTFHQCLGKGGFGEVYLATARRPGGIASKVAVKILKEGLDNQDEAVSRLRDEGRMLAILDHPCILRVHDMCRVAGRIALVMEYVEGIDMARVCKADRLLAPRVVVTALGEVAGALDKAWETLSPETGRPLHLVHRDLKPENIRLTVHGQVKLLDFGIARTPEMARDTQTRIGDLPFTPGYAAPESFRLGEQGPESDIYALGCTLYRLLAADRFFETLDIAEQFGIAARQKEYEPYLAARLQKIAHVPAPVFELCRSMLAWDKTARPTAAQTRARCEDLADQLPGPTLQRWARGYAFPPPKDVKDAWFTGQTLKEDAPAGAAEPELALVGAPRSGADARPSLPPGAAPPPVSTPRRSLHSTPPMRSDTPQRAITPPRSRSLPGEGSPIASAPRPPPPPAVRTATPRPAPSRASQPSLDARSISPAASRIAAPPAPPPASGSWRIVVALLAAGGLGLFVVGLAILVVVLWGLS